MVPDDGGKQEGTFIEISLKSLLVFIGALLLTVALVVGVCMCKKRKSAKHLVDS